jgi:23S rRNA pseudoU1915 N3-methylase RlmH
MEERNRCCLGGDEADTFVVTVLVTVHARRWSAKELARHLGRHRKFFIGGPAGKEGLLLEIVPDTLKKVEP